MSHNGSSVSHERLDVMRHSAAHVLAKAVQHLYPGSKLGIGPVIENGFYYDIDIPSKLGEDDLPRIEEQMRQIVAARQPFKREEWSKQQALEHYLSDDDNPYAYLRLGRQELIYGAQRYISPDDWRNVRRSFDGAKASLSIPNDTIDLFWVRPVVIERDQFDNDDPGTSFAGAYNALALPEILRGAGTKVETYLLALNQTRHSSAGADADTYTVGARFVTRPKPFDLDIEGNYQFGEYESASISAWSLASEAGVTFESIMLEPRASVGLDAASGATDPDGRFNQLFPPTYNYLGHLYLFGRPNLIDAHVGLDFHITKDLALYTTEHVFWRQNTNDGLYNLSGGLVRGDNGSDASYVGNEFDIVANWQINRHTSAYIGWAHFFAGDFLADTGPSQDADFVYASVTFTF